MNKYTNLKRVGLVTFAAAVSSGLAGCNGLQASLDNAERQANVMKVNEGKVSWNPEVSVPIWKSGGLKEKPRDISLPSD